MLGVITLIAHNTGKVIDLVVKSSYYQACTQQKKTLNDEEFEEWYEDNKYSCTLNHTGSSGKMEVDSIVEMFLRSIVKFGVKYLNYIGDGDSKIFAGVLKMIPYGEDYPVTKNECMGHVHERMDTRLRNKKKAEKLGGKNCLTEAIFKKLTLYYGLAIRRKVDSVEGMKKAKIATLDHYCSTDKSPLHQNCPTGADDRRVRDQIRARTQGAKEKIEDYLTCLLGLYDKLDGPYSVEEQLDNVHRGLRLEVRRVIKRKDIADFEELAHIEEKNTPMEKTSPPLRTVRCDAMSHSPPRQQSPKPGKNFRDNYAQRLPSSKNPKQNAAKINVNAISQAPSISTTIICRNCFSYGIPAPHGYRTINISPNNW